jgi:4'-phosphopantetheinyl transferase
MPVIYDIVIDSSTRMAVWHITESESILSSRLILDKTERDLISNIKVEKKKLQWLASRCLVRMMINTPEFITMNNNESGKPTIHSTPHNVSISHAGNYAAIILSDNKEVGIDIEEQTEKVLQIKNKFLSTDEITWMKEEHSITKLMIIWSAKESMFKWYARGNVDFKKNLLLDEFHLENSGTISALFNKETFQKKVIIHYEVKTDFIITWIAD